MATNPFYHNITLNTSTGSSTYGYNTPIWYADGTDRTAITTYGPFETVPIANHTYAIFKEVTKKDLKIMKEEIKKYMQDQMVKDAKEIAGQLFEDIEKLKKEKTQLEKSVTELKEQVKEAKADIKKELVAIEKLIEKRAKQIGKFARMDFS